MHLVFRNVNDAFRGLVMAFYNPTQFTHRKPYPTPITKCISRNGNVLMIDEPVTVTYTHPKERVLFNAARDANPFFHLYEALWMLAGRNDVAPLAYYAKQMREYSDDGGTLNGAYGYRWRHATYGVGQEGNTWYGGIPDYRKEVDQLQVIIEHLKANPTSRRVVLQMWNVENDLLKIGMPCNRCPEYPARECPHCVHGLKMVSKDVCCNLEVMFSLRPIEHPDLGLVDHILDMTVTNRSNDMIWGMLGANYVHFSILQEYIAAHLGVEVGRYNHFTNNLHVYEWNWKPEEWLTDETRGYYVRENSTFPLIHDPQVFDSELSRVVQNFSGEGVCAADEWREPFLNTVARPMFWAFRHYKKGAFNSALQWVSEIKADDWRVAAYTWIRRRMKRAQGK